jgi:UDP-N-acetylglucosamine 3-dehydrogenase
VNSPFKNWPSFWLSACNKDMIMDRLRIGALGTGIIIRDFHVLALQNHPKAEVVAAGNLHRDSLQQLANQFDIPKTYTSFEGMAADPNIDAVIIGLPNYLHAPATMQMLGAGKHVLCEKPMAMSVAEGQQMITAERRTGRKLMIAHM